MKKTKKTKKRTASEILKDLVVKVVEYNSLRDEEMDYEGDRDVWDAEIVEEYDELVSEILAKRSEVEALLREATGNESLEF